MSFIQNYFKKVIPASSLPEGEEVFLKKDVFGWRVVEPPFTYSGKIKWIRMVIGSNRTIVTTVILITLVLLFMASYNEANRNLNYIIDNKELFCRNQSNYIVIVEYPTLNISLDSLSSGQVRDIE